jgi:hypothetical protein
MASADPSRASEFTMSNSRENRSPPGHQVEQCTVRNLAACLVLTMVGAGASGCGEAVRSGRSPVVLVVNRLEGAPGADPAQLSSVLQSDVETLVERSQGGEQTSVPTLFADRGQAELRLALKDAGPPGSPATPTDNNLVTITRYRVSYRRTDGRNVPGVDVPYAFEGAATVTLEGTGPAVVALELVRVQAKQEPPLRNLRGGGGAVAISAIADVEFHGRDIVGHAISAGGALSVVFADWADP